MEIHRIDSLYPIRNPASLPTQPADARPASTDRVEISQQARWKSELRGVPDVRAEKIAALRKAIADGTYETSRAFTEAADRLLDDLK